MPFRPHDSGIPYDSEGDPPAWYVHLIYRQRNTNTLNTYIDTYYIYILYNIYNNLIHKYKDICIHACIQPVRKPGINRQADRQTYIHTVHTYITCINTYAFSAQYIYIYIFRIAALQLCILCIRCIQCMLCQHCTQYRHCHSNTSELRTNVQGQSFLGVIIMSSSCHPHVIRGWEH